MSLSNSNGYTNTTAFSTADVTPIDIDLATNYNKSKNGKGNRVIYTNITGSDPNQAEIVMITYDKVSSVTQENPNAYPGATIGGKSVNVQIQGKVRTTSSSDDTYKVDHPHNLSLTWRFENDEAITASTLKADLERLLGMLYNDDASGTNNLQRILTGAIDFA